MKSVDVSIIIVSYNTRDFLEKCLASLHENISSAVSYEVIVVDNGSTDDSASMVSKRFTKVHLIHNTNEGFAKANNRGVNVSKGRYVLFLNPDTVVYKNTIETVFSFMEGHPKVGAATCALNMEDGTPDYAAHRGFPTPWNSLSYFSGLNKLFPTSRLMSGYTLGWKQSDKTHEIDALAGAFMLTRREAGEDVGWWDEDYFFNGEDIDFCFRLKEKDWKIYYIPEVSILHYNGVSGGTKKSTEHISTATVESKRRITKARFNAMKLFYKKHYLHTYPRPVMWMVFAGIDLKQWLTMRKLR